MIFQIQYDVDMGNGTKTFACEYGDPRVAREQRADIEGYEGVSNVRTVELKVERLPKKGPFEITAKSSWERL